jgi:hypothetical protein
MSEETIAVGLRTPLPGSLLGQAWEEEFLSGLHSICHPYEIVYLFLPVPADSGTTTTKDKHAHTIYWENDPVLADYSVLGAGYQQLFLAAGGNEGSALDKDMFSFGDGSSDSPFSYVGLINPTTISGNDALLTKRNPTSNEEWSVVLYSGKLELKLFDESASAAFMYRRTAVFTVDEWALAMTTYSGTAIGGMNVFKNAVRDNDSQDVETTYIAMENLSAPLHIGKWVNTSEYDGSKALEMLIAGELDQEQLEAIVRLCNWYYDLSL